MLKSILTVVLNSGKGDSAFRTIWTVFNPPSLHPLQI